MDPHPSRPGSPEAPAGKAVDADMTDAAWRNAGRGSLAMKMNVAPGSRDDWTRPDILSILSGEALALVSTPKRSAAPDRRAFHHDETRALQVLDKSLRNDLRHDIDLSFTKVADLFPA